MAKTNETAAKKDNIFARAAKWCKNLGVRIARGFKDMYAELKKVTWPQRSELINYSVVVLAFMVVMGVIIFVIDAGAGALVQWITR